MKLIKTTEAVGHVLAHDLTRIVPGEFKGAQFRKGHIVTEEDIPMLLSMGKENLYVWEVEEGILHENEAAAVLRDICMGPMDKSQTCTMTASEPIEGKIEIRAAMDGLLTVNTEKLLAVNSLGEMMIATTHGNFPVKKGDKIAATRIIPLTIEQEKMNRAKQVAEDKPVLQILPFTRKTCVVITTGNEVKKGLISDAFTPVLQKKLAEYDVEILYHECTGDDQEAILQAIREAGELGVDMILCTGGMSVDPDDRTPGAIKASGAHIVSYGAPVLPGAMFLLGYFENGTPIMGLPGCVMYAGRTIFDLILPRVLAGQKLEKREIDAYGEGGLCLNCQTCHFPHCSFGK